MNQLNRLGFGAWQLANPLWSDMTEEEGIRLVKKAYDLGIRFFDTAPGYGNGLSEIILGKALKDVRRNVFIQSKFGHHADGHTDFSKDIIEESIMSSCKRLQTNYLDSVLLHNPEKYILEGKSTHFDILEQLKQKGLIKGYGASVDCAEDMILILNHSNATHIEVLFNIFFQDAREAFKLASHKGVKIITKVPLDSGWLTGKYDEHSRFDGIRSRWSKDEIKVRGKLIKELIDITHDKALVKYAMGYIWQYPEVSYIIPGIKNENQLQSHIEAAKFHMNPELKEQFEAFYNNIVIHKHLNW